MLALSRLVSILPPVLLVVGDAAAGTARGIQADGRSVGLHHVLAHVPAEAAQCLQLYFAEKAFGDDDPRGQRFPADPAFSGAWASIATPSSRLESLQMFFSGRQLTVPAEDLSALEVELAGEEGEGYRGRLAAQGVRLRHGPPTIDLDVVFEVVVGPGGEPADASPCPEDDPACHSPEIDRQRQALIEEMAGLDGSASDAAEAACP